ncbi:hypothetical protein JW979_10425, partial [bacterium]|nr:hypothetical protein [candidate division CSSED10-310 bacterium]
TELYPGTFIIFLIYEALAMILGIFVYGLQVIQDKKLSNILIFSGFVLSVMAAVSQTMENVRISVIWQFDNNGVFHIIQMIATIFLAVGVGLSDRKGSLITTSHQTQQLS